jgi:hypothetical protein
MFGDTFEHTNSCEKYQPLAQPISVLSCNAAPPVTLQPRGTDWTSDPNQNRRCRHKRHNKDVAHSRGEVSFRQLQPLTGADMSRPESTHVAPPTMDRLLQCRLRENFKIANQMKPYGNRLRFRLAHFDLADQDSKLRLQNARREMTDILIKKKIPKEQAQRAVAQALDIAADYQLEPLRLDRCLQDLNRSRGCLTRFIKQLDRLNQAIAKLPPLAKGKLNKIVTERDWRNFDTETFNALIVAMTDALSEASPACAAEIILAAINEKSRSGTHPAVVQIVRTARPALIELWETIPAETRAQVEANLRNWAPPKRRPVIEFVNRLGALLETFRPHLNDGRRFSIIGRLGQRLARIWHRLGLNVVSGRDNHQGTFQRFTQLARIAVVGDDSRLSNRQVTNLKSRIRRERDSESKSLKQLPL